MFIFGSGSSLNSLTRDEWRTIEAHDTIGFNWFVHERFVRCDYHLVREIFTDDLSPRMWWPQLAEYGRLVRSNPNYAETIFLVQAGFRATNGNRAIGLKLLPPNARLFQWRSIRGRTDPSPSLTQGLVHVHATLDECVNFARVMGWKTIVLAGVDLYDRRYFWLPPDETAFGDGPADALHRTASTGLIELLGKWHDSFSASGVDLFVYNPKSLLARTVPVWPGVAPHVASGAASRG